MNRSKHFPKNLSWISQSSHPLKGIIIIHIRSSSIKTPIWTKPTILFAFNNFLVTRSLPVLRSAGYVCVRLPTAERVNNLSLTGLTLSPSLSPPTVRPPTHCSIKWEQRFFSVTKESKECSYNVTQPMPSFLKFLSAPFNTIHRERFIRN